MVALLRVQESPFTRDSIDNRRLRVDRAEPGTKARPVTSATAPRAPGICAARPLRNPRFNGSFRFNWIYISLEFSKVLSWKLREGKGRIL